ncbi:tetratricopeptide repeat protein [Flammeovirga yaeyamensis]|uniref:Tetratricopeptide repeat protein n=1 Tax=Flammeovirga yaeyamensis TaxID=367791 RepID=A0AAX1ND34_9BACT|nr:CPBP family glutamic-type intramembrane protease [Flammeovirga yaeyamensis]MBB3696585.1 tetratricopeptide (TPR) repeat protein [Flammeovirga yaeyamensis]NMF33262.1 tetratricopeptide repeat protein [Flammeovirga yaeyamensis]QWG05459.1 tetratricopeptide repeat protein [Flammeovirga yaeyamensis]
MNNKRVFTAIFVTLITIIIISLLELLFLNKLTIIQIFYHGSIKEFTGLMIQLFFNSFTEEIIIKWFVLSQLLVKLKNRDQKWAIIITSLYFSFLHIPRFVDEGDTSYVLRGCIFTFLFSFITSFIYIKRRNFILIVVFHFLNNLPIEFDLEYHRFFQNTLLLFIFLYIFSWVDKIKLFDFYYSFKIKVNKKVSLIIGTLLLIIIYFLPNTNKDKYNFALGYYENDNNEKSLEYINQIIENDDTFSDAYVLKGRLQQDIYDFDSAIVNYDKAIELDTNNTEALYYRGIVHHNMKNYEAAIQDLKDPIERKYNTVTAYQARGESYFKLNEYQKAIYDFNEAAVLKKGNITAYRGLGKTYVKLEEFDKGIEYFEKALFYGDSSYLNLFYLLDAQMQKNDDVNVEKVFKMIKAREFSIDKYYFVRANMSLYYGDYQEAIGHLKESVKYGYPKGVTYYFISVTYQKLDDIENEKKYLLYSADEGYQEAERILKERFGIRIIE